MARERIIEGTWSCRSCGLQGILGRHKSCTGCGNPRETSGGESTFDFGERTASGGLVRESVTDAAALSAANAGADWFCAYCGASNRGDHSQCRTCSAAREDARRPAAATPQPLAAVPRRGIAGLSRWLLFGCATPIAVLCSGFCGYIFWASQTKDYPGTVVRVAWSRTAQRETFTRVEKRGWRDELRPAAAAMPVNGVDERSGVERVRGCRPKQRGTRQVADGTERVCSTRTRSVACGTEERCRTEDLGNGFAKEVCTDVTRHCDESYEDCRDETRYRTEPVYGEECTYDTWEWHPTGGASALTGSDDTPRWPEVAAGALDRVVRTESYEVELEYEQGGKRRRLSHHPKTEAEFERWPPGTKWLLVVANDGTLKGFREGDQVRSVAP